jgi:hypothetical protein
LKKKDGLRVIICKGKVDMIRKSALLLLEDKGFTYPSEVSREADCSWYMADKILLELADQMNLKIHYAGRTKLFLDV